MQHLKFAAVVIFCSKIGLLFPC